MESETQFKRGIFLFHNNLVSLSYPSECEIITKQTTKEERLKFTVVGPAREGDGVFDIGDPEDDLQESFESHPKSSRRNISKLPQLQIPV